MERTSSVSYTVTRQAQLKIATSKENRMNTSRATLWKVLCSPLISAENAQRAFVSDTTKGLQTDMGLWLKEMLQSSSDGHDSASLCPLLSATSAPPPSPLHLIFLQHRFGVCRLRAQDLGSLRAKTLWQARSDVQVSQEIRHETWALLCSRHKGIFDPSPPPREMSVPLKDTGEPREREPSMVARFHAVSLIFCLASEIYFSRRWERTWNKIDLGWANIWQRSVGNNHLSWEISTPGDIDGTKNICLSPQSHGIQFSSVDSFNPSAVNLSIYFYFWSVDLPGGEWKALVCSRCSHTRFWCLGWVEN